MDAIDEVRRYLVLSIDRITFPNVVVVGDQSSGKSTLLEALSLVELPKGNGIVTRCPLILRLRHSDERKVYRFFDKDRKILLDETNLNMSQYIEQETKTLAGNQKNAVQDFIELEIENPHMRDLTVVDLPGIIRNPLEDQPANIHEQTKDLINKYISEEGYLILCVFPADVDIATVESIALARKVDPEGKQTIDVITKSDRAPDPNRLIELLQMDKHDVRHLKLGFVTIRNRSTYENISLEDARKREKEFFNQHPAASVIDQNRLGIEALINCLATLYSQRVKETFPKMQYEIESQLRKVREQLSKLPPCLKTNEERLAAYNELIDVYVETILKVGLTDSNHSKHTSMVNSLHQNFIKYRNIIRAQRNELFTDQYLLQVKERLSKIGGEGLPNFLPISILKELVCEKLNQLWEVTNTLTNDCFRATINQLLQAESDACKDNFLFLKIVHIFRAVSKSYIDETRKERYDQLRALVELEQNDPYTINTYYMDIIEKYKELSIQNSTNKTQTAVAKIIVLGDDDGEDLEVTYKTWSVEDQSVQQMLISMHSYWQMITKRYMDYVTLAIRDRIVFSICANIKQRLRQIPAKKDYKIDIHEALSKDFATQNRREKLEETEKRLMKASSTLREAEKTLVNDD
ncbi:unnamed protein product [Rotaria sp. Silwood2]|nr:unnamed protein product [Rotaria sp. Silwood2]CAF4430394.1 unnamed protein product [Rotaria sp. Silwood2]